VTYYTDITQPSSSRLQLLADNQHRDDDGERREEGGEDEGEREEG
jgi:hypothetical protein